MRGASLVVAVLFVAGCATAPPSTPADHSDEVLASLHRVEAQLADLSSGEGARKAEIQKNLVALELKQIELETAQLTPSHPMRRETEVKIARLKEMLAAHP